MERQWKYYVADSLGMLVRINAKGIGLDIDLPLYSDPYVKDSEKREMTAEEIKNYIIERLDE